MSSPARAALFIDFDGTLSEIVAAPDDARPLDGVADVLADLSRRYGVVAVVSGRSAGQLLEWLGAEVEIWGTHGVERTHEGRVVLSEQAAPFEELIGTVAGEARALVEESGLDGIVVEDKAVMVGLHYRMASDQERARRELERVAGELSQRHGLTVASGRLALELRPPIEFSKRTVVDQRAAELEPSAACFIGDDTVDLPGFDALDALASKDVATLRVAVDSDEAPAELMARADLVVQGPPGVLKLLRTLAG